MKAFQNKNLENIRARFEARTGVSLTEQTSREATQRIWMRKPLSLVAVAALSALLLGTAVVGARVVKNGGWIEDCHEVYSETDENGNSEKGQVYEVSLTMPIGADAPSEIETFYLPQIPDTYPLSFGYLYDGRNNGPIGLTTFAWDVPNGEKQGIMFYQYSLAALKDAPVIKHNILGQSEPVISETVYGGAEGILLPAPDEELGRKYFYWSDGDYVFMLRVPYDFTDEQLDTFVKSVFTVEDERSYLVSMTEDEMDKSLK